MPYFGGLFPDEPLPENGYIQLPDRSSVRFFFQMLIALA